MATGDVGTIEVRRVGGAGEIHAGFAGAGRRTHLVSDKDVLVLVGNPTVTLRCRGQTHALPPGMLCVVETGEVIGLELAAAAPYRALYLSPGVLPELTVRRRRLRATGKEGRVAWVAAGAELCQLADRVDSDDGVARLVKRAAAMGGCRVRNAADERIGHAVVHRVRDYLREGYARKVTLEELARMAGMCRFALVRAFTREVGIPPHTYQTHLRVLRARELISAGQSLSDVSLEVGFTDQSHLNRHFKRLVGTTPGVYARETSSARTDRLCRRREPSPRSTGADVKGAA